MAPSGKLDADDARFVVVLATNIREILDKAVLDRIAGTSKCVGHM